MGIVVEKTTFHYQRQQGPKKKRITDFPDQTNALRRT